MPSDKRDTKLLICILTHQTLCHPRNKSFCFYQPMKSRSFSEVDWIPNLIELMEMMNRLYRTWTRIWIWMYGAMQWTFIAQNVATVWDPDVKCWVRRHHWSNHVRHSQLANQYWLLQFDATIAGAENKRSVYTHSFHRQWPSRSTCPSIFNTRPQNAHSK